VVIGSVTWSPPEDPTIIVSFDLARDTVVAVPEEGGQVLGLTFTGDSPVSMDGGVLQVLQELEITGSTVLGVDVGEEARVTLRATGVGNLAVFQPERGLA
jgi:hypothetical protein